MGAQAHKLVAVNQELIFGVRRAAALRGDAADSLKTQDLHD